MFGEELMISQVETSTDDKGRMIIPIWTKREVEEKLALLKDDEFEFYRLYSPSTLKKIYDQLNQKIFESKTNSQELYYKKKLLKLSKSIIKCNKIDEYGRLCTGLIKKKINLIGAGDHLILEIK